MIDSSCKNEVVFMKPLDCMCPQRQYNNVPLNVDVWMMALLFSDFCNSIHKLHGLGKVPELVSPTDLIIPVLFDLVPSSYRW